jgi:hypothetical protein
MKTNTSWPLLLAATFTLTACQEQVATELSTPAASATGGTSGGGTSTGGSSSTEIEEGEMRLSLVSSGTGYVLHETNEIGTAACEVSGISSITPASVPASQDVTCTLEAEELELYLSGFDMKIEAGENTCDYLSYEPFSFYRFRPGISARQSGAPRVMLEVTCDEDTVVDFGGTLLTTAVPVGPASAYTLAQACNKVFNIGDTGVNSDLWGNLDVDASAAGPLTPRDSVDKYCSFNYKNQYTTAADKAKAPNCDEGNILYYRVSLTVDPDLGLIYDEKIPDAATSCGGTVTACMGGPMPDLLGNAWIQEKTRAIVTKSTEDSSFSVEYAVSSPFSKKYATNMYAANFMRQCSGVDQFQTLGNFIDGDGTLGVAAVPFEADNMTLYSLLTTDSDVSQETDSAGLDIVILGDDAFRAGLTPVQVTTNPTLAPFLNYYVRPNPHYTFLCLDKAKEPKARIRLVVRDWNRQFPASADFRFISDIYKAGASQYQEASGNHTMPPYAPINYRQDWDDFLVFDDSGAADCSTSFVESGAVSRRSAAWFPRIGL